jgi:hypothetical protein
MNTSVLPETPLSRVLCHELQAIRGKWIKTIPHRK